MNKKNNAAWLSGLLSLAILMAVLLGYVYTHKAFTAENLFGTLIAIWRILVALSVVALAGGIGERILKASSWHGLERLALGVALGVPVLGISMLLLGSTLGTGILPCTLFLVVPGVVFRNSIRDWFSYFKQLPQYISRKYTAAIAGLCALIFLMHLWTALAPPVHFDSLVYHFSMPQVYLQLGKIQYISDNIFWGMPQTAEMLYLPAMRLAGAESAALVMFFIGLTAVLGIVGFTAERLGKIAAWSAAAALLAGETLTIALSSGYVEWLVILFGWAALACLDQWFETHKPGALALCGVICGAALGTKYTAGIILLGCLVALAILPGSKTLKGRLSNLLLVGGLAALVSLPWWLKNALSTSNPFYPFFFPAGAMNELRLYHYQKVPIWGDWRSVILLPWQASLWGVEGGEGFSASIGAILAGLSPLAWIGWSSRSARQKSSVMLAAIFVLTGFLIWAVGSRMSGLLIQSRLYVSIFPAWAFLAGAGLDAIWGLRAAGIRFGRIAAALVLLMLGFNLFTTWRGNTSLNPLACVLHQEEEHSYLARSLGSYANAMEALDALPAQGRVLMLWEARGLACQPKCDADEVIDRWYEDVHTFQVPEKILASWHAAGYTHLLFHQAGANYVRIHEPRLTSEDWDTLERLLASLPPPRQAGSYQLYDLRAP